MADQAGTDTRPNIVLIMVDDMGFFGYRLLRLGDRDAERGRAGGERGDVHPVLQLRPLLPDTGFAADRALPAPGRYRAHDAGPGDGGDTEGS